MYKVLSVDGKTWKEKYSEHFHVSTFGFFRDSKIESADMALVAFKDNVPFGYVQCIEISKNCLYWQLGGALEHFQGSIGALPAVMEGLQLSLRQYPRIETRVLNTNIRMLHMAMKMGFRIFGTRFTEGEIYVELYIERNNNV